VADDRREIILVASDAGRRAHVRALLERDGFVVNEAQTPDQLRDFVRASRAFAVLVDPADVGRLDAVRSALEKRPDLDLLVPEGFGRALLDGALGRRRVATFAADSLYLLATIAERAARTPALAERVTQSAELTAARLKLSRLQVETVSACATLVALGPTLAKLMQGAETQSGAEAGVSKELHVALAAAVMLRSPYPLGPVLEAVEERWDGRGRPRGLAGQQIPMASRVVAVARDYAVTLAAQGDDEGKALQILGTRSGAEHDPFVVDAFCKVLRDTAYVRRVEANRGGPRVAVVDGDAAALAVAELRLSAVGFSVQTFQDGRNAETALSTTLPDAVVTDFAVPRFDGISLLIKLRRTPGGERLPVFFTSATTDRLTVTKALKLGATDVMAKPVNFDVLVAKIRDSVTTSRGAAALSKSGVRGNLAEMAITDLLQVLAFGRRTATIQLDTSRGRGSIAFEAGEPVAAVFGTLAGMDAFSELAAVTEGSFSLESTTAVIERNLTGNIEALLLEALRRQDEAQRALKPA
jgi:two-component system chemotaxis response regulator CheY